MLINDIRKNPNK